MKIELVCLLFIFVFSSCNTTQTELEFQEEDLSSSSGDFVVNNPASLYASNCASCHGVLESSDKLDKTVAQIQSAIQNIPTMQGLNYLSQGQIELIEEALSFKAPTILNPAPFGELSASVTTVQLKVDTDEFSSCRFSSNSTSYDNMVENMTASSNGLAHTRTISVSSNNAYTYYVQCADKFDNRTTVAASINFSIADSQTPDTTPPAISQISPVNNSNLASNTTSVVLSFATNENATCRYSINSNFNYGEGSIMQGAGSMSHSQSVSSLSAGQSYAYYFLCRDTEENETSKFSTSFNINSINLNGANLYATNCASCHNTLASSEKLNRSASDIASAINNIPSMAPLSFLTSAQHEAIAEALSFNPPVMSALAPTGELNSDTTSVNLTVTTSEQASCKYSTSNTTYSNMSQSFNTSNGTSHTRPVTVSEGNSYTYYVQCQDQYGNETSSAGVINFSVRSASIPDTTPPVISSLDPAHESELAPGTTTVRMTFITDEVATCRYSLTQNRAFAEKTKVVNTDDVNHRQTIGGRSDGESRTYYFQCSDETGNIGTEFPLTWTIRELNLDGEALYQENCLGCHGALATSNKRNRSALQIKNAINQNSTMLAQSFLQLLTDEQIEQIANALSAPIDSSGSETGESQKYVLGTRRYVVSKFKNIFMQRTSNSADNSIKSSIEDLIENNSNSDFGGTCSGHSSDCPGDEESVRVSGLMLPDSTTVRRAYFVRACRKVLSYDQAIENALERINLTVNSADSDANIDKLYDLFYPGLDISPQVRSDLKAIYTGAKNQSMSNTRAWRAVMSVMCKSVMFELY